MNAGEFLNRTTKILQSVGIKTARLDSLVALEDETGHSRAWLLAHPEFELSKQEIASLNNFITRRSTHLPLSYYRGRSEFYGRSFDVNTHVLVPRPETESIINLLKNTALPARPKIADIGTGSGCIGVTAALEIPAAEVCLYDIDTAALQVAKQNAAKHNVRVHADRRDLLAAHNESFDVLLANLPYIPKDYPINLAAKHEPTIALFSGEDGLDHYRRFWEQVGAWKQKPLFIFTESLLSQHSALTQLAETAGFRPVAREGLVQKFCKAE